MNRVFLAALALACVCSPALADTGQPFDLSRAAGHGLLALMLGAMLIGLVICAVRRLPWLALAAVAFVAIGLVAHPALAQETTASPGVTIPYGQWIVDFGPQLAGWAATALATAATWAIAKWAPWAASIATQERIQTAAEALAQYAIKAVPNSVKDGKVTVDAGPAVIAAAVQRGVNVLPGRVVDAMIKGGGMSSIVFRVLDLEDSASEHNVLQPAIQKLQADPKAAKAA